MLDIYEPTNTDVTLWIVQAIALRTLLILFALLKNLKYPIFSTNRAVKGVIYDNAK